MKILVSWCNRDAAVFYYDRYDIDLSDFSVSRNGRRLLDLDFVDADTKGGSYYYDYINPDLKINSDIIFLDDEYPPYFQIFGTVYLLLDAFKVTNLLIPSAKVNSSSISEYFIFEESIIKTIYKSIYLKNFDNGDISANVFINFHKDFISIYRPRHFYSDSRVVEYEIFKIPLKKEFTKCCLKQCFEPNKYILYKD